IWQDLAARQREEALRQATSADARKRFQEAVDLTLKMATLPPAQIEQLLQEGEQHSRELAKLPPEQQRLLWDSPAEAEWRRRHYPAGYLWSPIGRALAGLLGRLSSQQWAVLNQGQLLIFTTDPQ